MKTTYLLTLSGIFLTLHSIFGAPIPLNEASCPRVDFDSHFGPVRDQDGADLCAAFAGAGLLEEHYCLENSALCGKGISVLDSIRCEFAVKQDVLSDGLFRGAYSAFRVADCGLREGVCSVIDDFDRVISGRGA